MGSTHFLTNKVPENLVVQSPDPEAISTKILKEKYPGAIDLRWQRQSFKSLLTIFDFCFPERPLNNYNTFRACRYEQAFSWVTSSGIDPFCYAFSRSNLPVFLVNSTGNVRTLNKDTLAIELGLTPYSPNITLFDYLELTYYKDLIKGMDTDIPDTYKQALILSVPTEVQLRYSSINDVMHKNRFLPTAIDSSFSHNNVDGLMRSDTPQHNNDLLYFL